MSQEHKKSPRKSSKSRAKKADESLEILGVAINGTHKSRVLKRMWLQRKNMLHVATVNPEFVMEARSNRRFSKILAQTELKVADGWGVVRAARLLGQGTIERVTGTELVEELLRRADRLGERVFLLGARPGVAKQAARVMQAKYTGAKYDWYEGAQTVRVEKSEEASMTIARVNAFGPDYLLVAYGSPWQDIWLEENKEYLRARVGIGVGGVLDEWAGVVRACPAWLDRVGGKWLWRFAHEPQIRGKRIMRVLKFAALVLYHKLID